MTKYSTDRRTEKLLCAHLHTRQGECGTTGQCISTFLAARYCRRLPERASSPTPEKEKKQPLLENNVISNGQMRLIVHSPNSLSVSRDETTAQAKRLTGSPTTRSVSPPGWPCQPQRVASSEPGRQPSTGTNYYKGQDSHRVVFAHEVGVFLAFGADVPGNVPRCRIFRSIDLNSARASAARKLDHAARGLLRETGKPLRCLARASAPRSDSRNTHHGPVLRPGGPN